MEEIKLFLIRRRVEVSSLDKIIKIAEDFFLEEVDYKRKGPLGGVNRCLSRDYMGIYSNGTISLFRPKKGKN